MSVILGALVACSPIVPEETHKYKLTAFNNERIAHKKTDITILVSETNALDGYQTEQMLYTNKLYQISAFTKNSWASPPANMLTPLIVQSLQSSNYFYAVAFGPNTDKTDYRLDTQMLSLQQNFLTKPSTLEVAIQATLTHVEDNKMIATHIFNLIAPCPSNSPYGGVIAANNVMLTFTRALNRYVISSIKHDAKI